MARLKCAKIRPNVVVKVYYEGDYCCDRYMHKQCPFLGEKFEKNFNLRAVCALFGRLRWGPSSSSPPLRHSECIRLVEKLKK